MRYYKKISSKILYNHPRTTLQEDSIILPNGSESTYLVYKDLPDSSVLIIVKDKKILLSKEYTYPLDDYLIQIPGGTLEINESPLDTAKRELLEETGYTAKNYEYLGFVLQNHRRSTAKMHYFLVTDLTQSMHQREPHEFIELEWFTLNKLNQDIKDNKVTHEGTLAGLTLLNIKHPGLL